MDTLLGIRQVAARFELAPSTLHYWERRGLIAAHRLGGNRFYDAGQLHRIALIRLWQATALMSLDEIAAMLRGRTESSSWRDIVIDRIAAIEAQLEQLRAAHEHLGHMLSCPRDNPAADCPVLRRQVATEGASD